jgi:tryptophan 2,3-dioxygenase
MNYGDYLGLGQILDAQHQESSKSGQPAHDEMLFIIVHQAYELWFKQILHELTSCLDIMKRTSLNDNSPELQTIVHRLSRIATILKLLVQQIDVMETMTAMDFLEFRDLLRPASGFQSWQFKMIEAKLGLRFAERHGQDLYNLRVEPLHAKMIADAETGPSMLDLVNKWLERMPFFEEPDNWKHFQPKTSGEQVTEETLSGMNHIFWKDYRNIYKEGLSDAEQGQLASFDAYFFETPQAQPKGLSSRARRSALFIMLYRGYPILQLPFHLLNYLLEIDAQLSTWRYRHMNMVKRMIGTRTGTGGSSGKDYLQDALNKHYIFSDIARLTSFLADRRRLPVLSIEMERRLGFAH